MPSLLFNLRKNESILSLCCIDDFVCEQAKIKCTKLRWIGGPRLNFPGSSHLKSIFEGNFDSETHKPTPKSIHQHFKLLGTLRTF